jgi:hypothetical protein
LVRVSRNTTSQAPVTSSRKRIGAVFKESIVYIPYINGAHYCAVTVVRL